MSDPDVSVLLPPTQVVYTRRWYILIVFSVLAMMQATVWNTWGPIAETVNNVYHWSDKTVSLLSLWGTITFLAFFAPFLWLTEVNLRFVNNYKKGNASDLS